MKVLILHLSDIHIRGQGDAILRRAPHIVDAVKNLEPETRSIICVLSGDITYSGTEDQFILSLEFVTQIRKELRKHIPSDTRIWFLAIPGNHDCDFTEQLGARSVIREVVQKAPSRLADPSFAAICLEPQRRFFQFLPAIDPPPSTATPRVDSKLYAEYRINVRGDTLLFCCYNTAALSELHERPGSLVFPSSLLTPLHPSEQIVVSVAHHPFNWLAPENAREFRDRVEAVSDLILTGHEHVLDKRNVNTGTTNSLYLEGGVLQDSEDDNKSEFYAIVIDIEAKKQRIIGYSWSGQRYSPAGSDDPQQYYLWEDFARNRLRLRDTFQLQPDYATFLENPELELTHRAKGNLKLSDIYVFPDLKRVNLAGEKTTKILRGESIPELIATNPCLFIIGNDISGKTALSKTLFKHLHSVGDVPVLINAANVALSPDDCREQLEQCFLKNYQASALNHYRQLDRVNRVVIIDNYHRLKLTSRQKRRLIENLRKESFRLIIFAHDIAITLSDISEGLGSGPDKPPFAYYSILPFSPLRRSHLIEKWLLLSNDTDENTTEFVQKLSQITKIVDTLIGKNYVPAFPPYLLAVLQGVEADTDIDINASTHGYLYELFIKAALAKAGSAVAYNVLSSYLSHLAHWMFRSQRKDISESELRSLHDELQERFEVIGEFERQEHHLLAARLLTRTNDLFAFTHPYIYYYFLALYLRDHLSDPGIKSDVVSLSQHLNRDESSSTLLFLAHLSKDRFLIQTLLDSAAAQFRDQAEATLDQDVVFLNKLDGTVGQLKLPDEPTKRSREKALTDMEKSDAEQEAFEKAKQADLESDDTLLGRINSALKTIQILGQVLKNFPADFEKPEKDRIINACCSVGRRVLGMILTSVEQNESAYLTEMLHLISRRKPNIAASKLRDQAVLAVSGLSALAATGMVIRMSHALGSKELITTYDRFFPPLEEPIMRLVYVSLQLEHYAEFPEGLIRDEAKGLLQNAFAFRILRALVVRYLALFPTDFRLKQRLSKSLKLEYRKVRVPSKEQRLLE